MWVKLGEANFGVPQVGGSIRGSCTPGQNAAGPAFWRLSSCSVGICGLESDCQDESLGRGAAFLGTQPGGDRRRVLRPPTPTPFLPCPCSSLQVWCTCSGSLALLLPAGMSPGPAASSSSTDALIISGMTDADGGHHRRRHLQPEGQPWLQCLHALCRQHACLFHAWDLGGQVHSCMHAPCACVRATLMPTLRCRAWLHLGLACMLCSARPGLSSALMHW
jgi:hypothetical protein